MFTPLFLWKKHVYCANIIRIFCHKSLALCYTMTNHAGWMKLTAHPPIPGELVVRP